MYKYFAIKYQIYPHTRSSFTFKLNSAVKTPFEIYCFINPIETDNEHLCYLIKTFSSKGGSASLQNIVSSFLTWHPFAKRRRPLGGSHPENPSPVFSRPQLHFRFLRPARQGCFCSRLSLGILSINFPTCCGDHLLACRTAALRIFGHSLAVSATRKSSFSCFRYALFFIGIYAYCVEKFWN